MKILTIGNGFISEHLNYELIPDRLEYNINQIENILDKYKPDVLINCIGKTGRPNIDWCESNKLETTITNTALPILLAQACNKKSIHLIHIGSGCIFFGPSPYVERAGYMQEFFYDYGWEETDFANPQSYYSKTKYACDLVLGDMPNVSILRIRMPISTKNSPRNFINKVKNYSHIIDIQNSVTFTDDLVNCVSKIANNNIVGTYHVTNPGSLSAVQVIEEYRKYFPQHKYEIISEEQLNKITAAKRSNCILNTDKLKSIGIYMTPAKEALVNCMKEYVKNL